MWKMREDQVSYISSRSLTLRFKTKTYEMLCAIWYHLHNLINVKNTHSRVLLLVKLQAAGTYVKNGTNGFYLESKCKAPSTYVACLIFTKTNKKPFKS